MQTYDLTQTEPEIFVILFYLLHMEMQQLFPINIHLSYFNCYVYNYVPLVTIIQNLKLNG